MAPATLLFSMPLPPRTRPAFPSSATPETRPSQDMVVVPFSPVAEASAAAVVIPAVDEEASSSVPPVADRAMATSAVDEVVLVPVVDVASAGRTTTSLLATVMPASTSRPTGSFSRRSTSTAWPSSTLMLTMVRTWTTTVSFTTTTAPTTSSLSRVLRGNSRLLTVPPTTSPPPLTLSSKSTPRRTRLPSSPPTAFSPCLCALLALSTPGTLSSCARATRSSLTSVTTPTWIW